MGQRVGVEAPQLSAFLVEVVWFLILVKALTNFVEHAGTASEVGPPVES